MRCDDVRESLSAHLDGEAMPLGADLAQEHLARCSACQAWLDGARRLTHSVRAQPVPAPDLTARILTEVHAATARAMARPAAGRLGAGKLGGGGRVGLRWALGGLAVLQLMLAVPELLGASGHAAHAGREVAAFDIALAVGLLVVACYPEHARVFAPVALTLVLCFAAASALDIMQQAVAPGQVAVHVLAALQAGLVWLLARTGAERAAST